MSINSIFNNTSPFHVPGTFIHILPSYNRYHICILKVYVSHSSMFLYQEFIQNYIIKTFHKKKNNFKNIKKKGAVFITLSYGAFNLTFLHLYPSELWRVYFDLFALTLQF